MRKPLRRRLFAALAGLLTAVCALGPAGAAASAATAPPQVRVEDLQVAGTPEADGTAVSLDATLYAPAAATADSPAPAVLLAHGFGGTKSDVAEQARALATAGYVGLAWTARGFGRSGGLIHLDAPDFEVADASRLLDLLAERPEVALDAPGDPTAAVAGGSYGGALALMLAATDDRVDAAVPAITWHDLRQGLVPQQAVSGAQTSPADVPSVTTPGVFKRAWAGLFFGSGSRSASGACGRFAADLCDAYAEVARTGVASQQVLDRLARSSPAPLLSRLRAPTLLLQGERDSLFPLSEADANAAAIAATGTPVSVVWFDGGHDGAPAGEGAEAARLQDLTLAWLDHYLRGRDVDLPAPFEVTVPARGSGPEGAAPVVRTYPGLPGVTGPDLAAPQRVRLTGPAQDIASPAGGTPAALSSLPGLGLLGLQGGAAPAPPDGQSATFGSDPLVDPLRVVGSSRIRLRVSGSAPDLTLFAALQVVAADGTRSLPERLVAPVRVVAVPPGGTDVDVALPAVVLDVPAGSRVAVVVTSTDQAYALPTDARTYTVALADGAALEVPRIATAAPVPAAATPARTRLVGGVGAAVVLLVVAVVLVARRRRRVTPAA